jgi:XTP/dITP diphosphohydrolase
VTELLIPHRKLVPGRLVIASHNPGKVREIEALLGPYGAEPVSAAKLDIPEPDETGTTFVANAELKARAAADLSGLPALADDSGLCVEALNGEPGIFSARWAGPSKDFGLAMRLVHQALAKIGPDAGRDAHFVCALSLAWPDGHVESFEGRVDGILVWPPRGTLGFGYDPMFEPLGHDISFGEMDPDAKHAMSHRADAFRKLVAAVF